MNHFRLIVCSIVFISGCAGVDADATANRTRTIAIGSCLRQTQPQPVWEGIDKVNPELFILMGDNVYADTEDPARMRSVYSQLAEQSGYRRLKDSATVLATWDDHDYGQNDGGADYVMKHESRDIFLQFFDLAGLPEMRDRQGIYREQVFGRGADSVQVILLDTRFSRSPLKPGINDGRCKRPIAPNTDAGATLLGEQQWRWLEKVLKKPAALRLLVSSIQVIPDSHCFEKWANFPLERKRLLDLIARTEANGVIFLSGDRHLGDISRLHYPGIDYPLYELTASGMNSARGGPSEPNRYRVIADNVREDHFGTVRIDHGSTAARIHLDLRDIKGRVIERVSLPMPF